MQEDGSPLVGVEATCREELDFFEQSLAQPEPEPRAASAAALAAARGLPAGLGTIGDATAAALVGLPGFSSYQPRPRGRAKRKGSKGFP